MAFGTSESERKDCKERKGCIGFGFGKVVPGIKLWSRTPDKTPKHGNLSLLYIFALSFFIVSGCATIARNPLTADTNSIADIPGMPDIRYWADSVSKNVSDSISREMEQIKEYDPGQLHRSSHILAISGGGDKGAFGAGLLVGWSEAGNRPEFTIVTGISTGALIAPFAFLGSAYDERLKQVYTTTSTENIFKIRALINLLSGDSVTDTTPLKNIIKEYMTRDMLRDIAAEYKKGRRLIIGTTNLDAKRPVMWDITAIAASGHKDALKLFHEVILASASIPGAFPPVYIKVRSNGKLYDEMHVDGGMSFQVFLYPPQLDHKRLSKITKMDFDAHIYIIRNAYLEPVWKAVRPRIGSITTESVSTLVMNQGMGNVELMYFLAMRDGYDYNLAYIPSEFQEEPKEQFDPDYMKKLFDVGYNLAKDGYPWQKIPPRLKKPEEEQ